MTDSSLKNKREEIQFLFKKGIEAALPKNLFLKFITLRGNSLTINSINNPQKVFDLSLFNNIYVTGAGKAGASMAEALEEFLLDRIKKGIIVTKYGFAKSLRKIKIVEAGHPYPDENSVNAAQEILELINSAEEKDLVINLISGGASSLLTLPADGISLEDKILTTKALLKCEASIDEINTIRKCLSKVKGGGLISETKAAVISLIISDVIGDDLGTVASGPTVVSEKDYEKSRMILKKYNLEKSIPKSVLDYLNNHKNSTINKNSVEQKKHQNFLIGNNDIVIEEIVESAKKLGFDTYKIDYKISGEVNNAAAEYFKNILQIKKSHKPLCIISGGETTVNIKGNGLGGRNQQFCLALAEFLKGQKNIISLSGGTDGNDGPTNAAGAFIDYDLLYQADELNLDYKKFLDNNDSYNFLNNLNALIITGPTFTNVMDIQISIIY